MHHSPECNSQNGSSPPFFLFLGPEARGHLGANCVPRGHFGGPGGTKCDPKSAPKIGSNFRCTFGSPWARPLAPKGTPRSPICSQMGPKECVWLITTFAFTDAELHKLFVGLLGQYSLESCYSGPPFDLEPEATKGTWEVRHTQYVYITVCIYNRLSASIVDSLA